MKFIANIFLFLLSFSIAFAQDAQREQHREQELQAAKQKFNLKSAVETSQYDVDYYRLDLSLDPAQRFVSGNVTTYFTSIDSISKLVFDLNNQLVVDSVIYHNDTIPFSQSASHTVDAQLPSTLAPNVHDSIRIYYQGVPVNNSGFLSFVTRPNVIDTVLWTFSVPYGAPIWWPCKNALTDKADSVDLIIHTPASNQVASNGLLMKVDTLAGNATYYWKTRYPIATYLIALAIADYDIFEEYLPIGNDSLLMQHFLYSNHNFRDASRGMEEFLHLYDSLFGPYPYMKEKYGHASFLAGGGMEHQTMSFMSNYASGLKAHEFAHQWFGNKITCGSWQDVWLNEGFATYLEALTFEFNAFHKRSGWLSRLGEMEALSYSFPNGAVFRNDTSDVVKLFNRQIYDKAAITLHTLRWEIGDSAFFQGIKNYITDTSLAFSFAKTEDLKAHLEASSGEDLTEFFDDWIYGKGYPTYHTNWSQHADTFSIHVRQVPSNASVSFFDIPVPYRLLGTTIDTIIVVDPDSSGQTFHFPIKQKVQVVELDPQNKIFALKGLITRLDQLKALEEQVDIFPNPAQDLLQLSYSPELRIEGIAIHSINGQPVMRIDQNIKRIDISRLPLGVYLIEVNSSKGLITRKFIKN